MNVTATPKVRIEQACRRMGREQVINRCSDLLAGGTESPQFIVILGGPAAVRLLEDGLPPGRVYWLRVWGARGLLWAGVPDDPSGLSAGLTDGSWRVREMVCKVIARHRVGDLVGQVAELESDGVVRVRRAAERAVRMITEAHA